MVREGGMSYEIDEWGCPVYDDPDALFEMEGDAQEFERLFGEPDEDELPEDDGYWSSFKRWFWSWVDV